MSAPEQDRKSAGRLAERRATHSATHSATHRGGDRPYAPAPPRRGMFARLARSTAVLCWLVAWVVATAAAATSVVDVDLPEWVAVAGGGAVTVLHLSALAHRAGARTWLWTVLGGIGTAAALASDRAWAVSSVSVLTAVVSGVAAVLLTRPAMTAWHTLVEYAIALLVASAGALAVAGINAPVRPERYSLVVAGLALLLAIVLIWPLGQDLHGLGRGGLALVLGGAAVAVGLLAYAEVLRTYGSPAIVQRLDETVAWLTENLHGVPRPVEALVGFPALVWGIGTRAWRRQGWWLCVLGVLGTATLAASLASPSRDPELAARSAAYSAVIGAVLGLLVRRIDMAVTRRRRGGDSGRRALRRDDETPLVRPEPGRSRPLD